MPFPLANRHHTLAARSFEKALLSLNLCECRSGLAHQAMSLVPRSLRTSPILQPAATESNTPADRYQPLRRGGTPMRSAVRSRACMPAGLAQQAERVGHVQQKVQNVAVSPIDPFGLLTSCDASCNTDSDFCFAGSSYRLRPDPEHQEWRSYRGSSSRDSLRESRPPS